MQFICGSMNISYLLNNNAAKSEDFVVQRHTEGEYDIDDTFQIFAKATSSYNEQNRNGDTVLHLLLSSQILYSSKLWEIVHKVVENCQHINTPNNKGNTPIFEVSKHFLEI